MLLLIMNGKVLFLHTKQHRNFFKSFVDFTVPLFEIKALVRFGVFAESADGSCNAPTQIFLHPPISFFGPARANGFPVKMVAIWRLGLTSWKV